MPGDSGKCGACLLTMAAIQFIVFMLMVQAAYPCYNGICYNLFTNPISDLGNTATSPLWPLFNYSLVMFGLLLFIGIIYLIGKFPKGLLRNGALAALLFSALGAIGVGVVPENTMLAIHSMAALIAFLFSGLGILLLGVAIARKFGAKRHLPYAAYTLISGAITVGVLLLYLLPTGGISSHLAMSGPGWGFGGVERVIAFPPILWTLVTGLYFSSKRGRAWK